jgi:small conductance mechanosensitive channel
VLGIDLILIATSLGIAGIAVGFTARDLLSNLIIGIFILIDRTYLFNYAVIISDTYGIVRLITLRNTEIKTFDGNIVIIPNSQVA